MRYLFRKTATEHAHDKTSHTVKYCKRHSCIWQSNLSKQMCHMMFQSSAFFFLVCHIQSKQFLFSWNLCVISGKTFLRCFSTLDQLAPLFLSSEPKGNYSTRRNSPFLTWRQILILSNGQSENKILCMPIPKTKTALFQNLHRKVYQNYTNPLFTVVINSFSQYFISFPLPSSHLLHLAQRTTAPPHHQCLIYSALTSNEIAHISKSSK